MNGWARGWRAGRAVWAKHEPNESIRVSGRADTGLARVHRHSAERGAGEGDCGGRAVRRKDPESCGGHKPSADSGEHQGRLWLSLGPATRALTPMLTAASSHTEGTGGLDQDAVTERGGLKVKFNKRRLTVTAQNGAYGTSFARTVLGSEPNPQPTDEETEVQSEH